MNKTILIVDDEMPTRTLLRMILQSATYTTLEAEDGEEALEIIAQTQPDMVLLDVMMPKLDGFAVCTQLRATEATAELPIIMLSADTNSATAVKGRQVGATMFLTKPVPRDQLLHIVAEVFSKVPIA